MREIKFRAWDEDSEIMFQNIGITPTQCITYNHNDKMIPPEEDWLFGRDTVVIMQYTGLKDKNGVDIYEDDILRCYHNNYYEDGSTSFITVITFMDGDFWGINEDCCLPSDCEVIGNIYQNPNLLK